MSGSCCDPAGYRGLFSEREAKRNADQYRRSGLDTMARRLVGHLEGRGLSGRSVLEIGGGVGAILIELLRRGASRAVNVELSPEYERVAQELARESGLADRVEHRVGDFAAVAEETEPADVVVLHRVVCCYPYLEPLLGAAADRARHALALTFPRGTPLVRLGFRLLNAWMWLTRSSFRAFVHPPAAIARIATDRGLRETFASESFVWRSVVFERT